MDPLVVTVVLNWNRPLETTACVASLLAGDYPRQQVLVVDNGSSDDSVGELRQRFGDKIEIVETGANLFYAGGNNVGLEWSLEAGADWTLILNNDTFVAPDMVSCLVQTALDHPKAGILAPMIYFGYAPSRIWALGGRRRRWLLTPLEIGRGEMDNGQFATPFNVDYVTGCAMLVRRDVLTQVGFFDANYRMYYEDADFCVRVQKAGFELWVEPRAKMWHLVSVSAKRQASMSRYQRTRYRIRFYRQHPHGPLPHLTQGLLWMQEMARVGGALIRGQPDLARAGWRGLCDGYRDKIETQYETD